MPDTKLIPGQSLYPSCHSEYNQYIFSNCLSDLFNTCLVNTVFPELDGPERMIDQGCLNRVSNSSSIIEMIKNTVT